MAQIHYSKLAFVVPRATLDNLAKIAEYDGPLMYSHGTDDRIVPIALGERLFDAAGGAKTFVKMPGADHNTRGTPDYYQRMQQFLDELPAVPQSHPQTEPQP